MQDEARASGVRLKRGHSVRARSVVLPEIAAVVLFIALIWLALYAALDREYRSAEREALQNNANLAFAYADNARRLVAGVDELLLALRSSYAERPDGFDVASWSRLRTPEDRVRIQIGLTDPGGRLIGSTVPGAVVGMDLSDREHVQTQLDPGRDDLFISKPVTGRVTGKQTVQFSRKLLRADGSFAGVGVVSVGCEELARFYEGNDLNGFVTMVGTDHTAVLASYAASRIRTLAIGLLVTLVTGLLGLFWRMQRRKSASFQRDLELMLGSVSQGIVMVDDGGRIRVVNQRAVELLGLPAEIMGRPAERSAEHLGPTADHPTGELRVLARGDKLIEAQARPTPQGGLVLTYSDVTERSKHEAQMSELAHHDRLTGLANRVLLEARVQEVMRRAQVSGERFALIALDLDNFKMVNDEYGHEFGDMLMVEAASQLNRSVRPMDTVARIGGDEFIVLIDGLASDEAFELTMQQLVDALAKPASIEGHSVNLGASAGLAVYPADGTCQRTLLRNADTALYEAKAAGRGTSRRFHTSMLERLSEQRWLESELRASLERGDITVHYQPQFDPHTLAVTGFETLARWRHPERGFISPALFIPVAEECGLITTIGKQVLQQACMLAANLPRPCRVAVNLSPIQFRDPGLINLVVDTLARTGLPADLLELEVTEGVLIHDESQALQILGELRQLGVRIALDDFGTGYSSLNYLRRFPFDRVKIDKSFVQAQEGDDRSAAILDAVLTLSSRLHLSVTAEGVETEAQLQAMRRKGVGEIQGFLLGRPMPGTEVCRFLTTVETNARRFGGSAPEPVEIEQPSSAFV